MNTNQTSASNILTKFITNIIRHLVSTIAKLSNKKPTTQQTEASALELKQPSDMNKAKTFNKLLTNVTYNTDKINRDIGDNIKKFTTDKILFTTTQVRLAISTEQTTILLDKMA